MILSLAGRYAKLICRTGPTGYIDWRNRFLGIDPGLHKCLQIRALRQCLKIVRNPRRIRTEWLRASPNQNINDFYAVSQHHLLLQKKDTICGKSTYWCSHILGHLCPMRQ